jgi:hypothetical protein
MQWQVGIRAVGSPSVLMKVKCSSSAAMMSGAELPSNLACLSRTSLLPDCNRNEQALQKRKYVHVHTYNEPREQIKVRITTKLAET